jgi:ribosomal protein S18 acetylase RimI-like enzyme
MTKDTPALELRVAGPADAARLLPMMASFNAAEGISVDERLLASALVRLLRNRELGCVWFILGSTFERHEVIGYAVLTFGYDLEFAGRDAFLTETYVEPEARGAGCGRSALAAIEAAARALEVRAIHLMVRPENAIARSLYESSGYEAPPRLFLSKRLGT